MSAAAVSLSMIAVGLAFQAGGPTASVAQGPQLSGPQLSGAQLIREGKLEEALEVYRQGVRASPQLGSANNGAGVVLDLLGRYAEARTYFSQAIKAAPTAPERVQAQRAMAISYGFTGDCRGAEKSDRGAYEYFIAVPDFYNAGEVANELGRLCLDAGDLNTAYDWYRRGHEAGVREENLAPDHQDLWDFRWAHARARIAARRGKLEEARKYVAIARTILDKGKNPAQQVYFAYLKGYVAFYAGDYAAALLDLRNAAPADPFVQCLLAQSYEKLGDQVKALEYYRMAASTTAHSVPAAFARPFAKAKLDMFTSH
jgi:Flp pilus assembly protein TadD